MNRGIDQRDSQADLKDEYLRNDDEYLHDEDEYLCNRQLESMSSWISFERENYVEDARGFRFAKFLIDFRNIGQI